MVEKNWGYSDRRDNRELSEAVNRFSLDEKTKESLRTLITTYLKIGDVPTVRENLIYFVFQECEGCLSHKSIKTVWEEEYDKKSVWCSVC